MSLELPTPDDAATDVSHRLLELICARAQEEGGALGFDRFMELALYAPGLGYYSGAARKFGRAGDFVTAPEMSPLFSRCLAVQVEQVLAALGGGTVLEFGAGSGVMAADLLAELERRDCLPAEYLILELSADLRARQSALLSERVPHLVERVRWLDRLPEASFSGAVLANEVLDAFAVHRFRIASDGVRSQVVRCTNQGPEAHWVAAPESVDKAVRAITAQCQLPVGYESEINLRLAPWVRALAAVLERGAALLIDYGYPRREYYHPQRDGGTLLCHYRHRAHGDPLLYPGLQDITAHVDFTAVAEAAVDSGLTVAGFATQAHFLIGCGIESLVAESRATDEVEWFRAIEAVKRLTLPSEMGERFKMMGLTRELDTPLLGFALQDLRGSL